ncbi:MAG: HigA family addiction module antidote protein [Treponema sp.]|jgi:addiction module HigA family antidote|nr:HigA family addiction module antidote protein [Treponema sp.]
MAKQTLTLPSAILEKLMENYGLNPSKLANAVNLNQTTLRLILSGKGKISCPIALKFAKFFGKTPEYWLNLQNQYDIAEALKDKELTAVLKNIKTATKAVPAKKEAKDAASKKKAAEKDASKSKKTGRPAADSKKTAKTAADKASGSRKVSKAAADKAAVAKKPAAGAGSKKTAKTTADKAPAAARKSAVKKPAAEKKAADSKPAGARRGRKPKSETAVSVPEPDPEFVLESPSEPDFVAFDPAIESDRTFESGPDFQEEATSETSSDLSFSETIESEEEVE